MEAIDTEIRKRNIAYKVRIVDLNSGTPFSPEGRFAYLDTLSKKVNRVNVIANCVDKFSSEGERKFGSLTVDDASGQIRLKVFGDDIEMINDVLQGDTLQIIGNVREWNNEIYIIPELIKKVDPRWLLVRKIEIQNDLKNAPATTNNLKEDILNAIKEAEVDGGIDIDNIVTKINSSSELVNGEIKKLIEDGIIYEPRPGRLRYLG